MAADPARLPYGHAWWLDAVCPHGWKGVVLEDYAAVLPLPKSRFFWARAQVQRPSFTQQVGPFGSPVGERLEPLLTAIPARYRLIDFPLAEHCDPSLVPTRFTARRRTNLVLPLTAPAGQDPLAGYGKTLRKKLRRHPQDELRPADPATVIDCYRSSVGPRIGLKPKHYRTVSRLMSLDRPDFKQQFFTLTDPAGLALAHGYFPTYRGRVLNLFAASTPAGYQVDGMARLLHAVIQRSRSDGDHTFDFEGSDVEGIAAFFRSFGPAERPYLSLRS